MSQIKSTLLPLLLSIMTGRMDGTKGCAADQLVSPDVTLMVIVIVTDRFRSYNKGVLVQRTLDLADQAGGDIPREDGGTLSNRVGILVQ